MADDSGERSSEPVRTFDMSNEEPLSRYQSTAKEFLVDIKEIGNKNPLLSIIGDF